MTLTETKMTLTETKMTLTETKMTSTETKMTLTETKMTFLFLTVRSRQTHSTWLLSHSLISNFKIV